MELCGCKNLEGQRTLRQGLDRRGYASILPEREGFNFFIVFVRSEASCEEIKRGEIDNLSKFQTRGRMSQKQIQRRRAERRVGTINTSWKIRSGDDEPASLPPLSSLPSLPCSPPPSPPPVALSGFRLRRPVCSVPVRLLKPFFHYLTFMRSHIFVHCPTKQKTIQT